MHAPLARRSWRLVTWSAVALALAATATATATATEPAPAPMSAPAVAAPDASVPGPLEVEAFDYDAQVTPVTFTVGGAPAGPAYLERLRGRITVASGPGPRPVVVVMHGRHASCRIADGEAEALVYGCPDAPPLVQDLPSWRGFDYLAENLASQGFLVLSVSANGVNSVNAVDGTEERAQVVAASLGLLQEWHDGARLTPDGVGARLTGRVDLSRIGLLGHSRGADGVGQFVLDEQARPTGPRFPGVKALLQLQAVDFAFTESSALAQRLTGVHFGTVLGTCDGDVGAGGAAIWDRGRFTDPDNPGARVQLVLAGANHNWFNTEWGDEWSDEESFTATDDDDACSKHSITNTRLTEDDQRRLGTHLLGAFFRRYVLDDVSFQGVMTGAAALPPAVCPTEGVRQGRPVACDDVVLTSYLAPAPQRLLLDMPGQATVSTPGLRSSTCEGTDTMCRPPGLISRATQRTLEWDGPGTFRADLAAPVDATAYSALTLRTSPNPSDPANAGLPGQDAEVVVVDADGAQATTQLARHTSALRRTQPNDRDADGTGRWSRLTLNGARLPLSAFAGVDLTRVVAVELRFGTVTSQGSIQLAELAFQQ